jgi:hypothetical protein
MGCCVVQDDIQSLMDDKHLIVSDVCVIVPVFHDSPVEVAPQTKNVQPLVIKLPGPVSYASTKAIPYKYNATMIENGVEVPLVSPATVDNVAGETFRLTNLCPGDSAYLFLSTNTTPYEIPHALRDFRE